MLPDDRVLLLTSASILLVHAPGFTQLEKAAEIGESLPCRWPWPHSIWTCLCGVRESRWHLSALRQPGRNHSHAPEALSALL
jgi:hypothetical protein